MLLIITRLYLEVWYFQSWKKTLIPFPLIRNLRHLNQSQQAQTREVGLPSCRQLRRLVLRSNSGHSSPSCHLKIRSSNEHPFHFIKLLCRKIAYALYTIFCANNTLQMLQNRAMTSQSKPAAWLQLRFNVNYGGGETCKLKQIGSFISWLEFNLETRNFVCGLGNV